MAEEGFDYYKTPIRIWLSHTLRMVHKNGGKPIPLAEYDAKQEQATTELLARLDDIQKTYEF